MLCNRITTIVSLRIQVVITDMFNFSVGGAWDVKPSIKFVRKG